MITKPKVSGQFELNKNMIKINTAKCWLADDPSTHLGM